MRIRGIIVSLLIVCGIVFAGSNGHRTSCYIIPPVSRTASSSGFVMPGYAQSVYWHKYDAITNANGYADYSAIGINYAKPAAGSAQPTWTNLIDGAVYLDGNDYLIGTNKPMGATSASINLWVKFTSSAGIQHAFSWQDNLSRYTTIGCGFPVDGKLRCRIRGTDIQPASGFPANEWMMLTITDQTSLHELYTNNVLAFSSSDSIGYGAQNTFLNIGQYFGGGFFFSGWIDEDYFVTGYVFTAQDRTNMWENGRAAHGL